MPVLDGFIIDRELRGRHISIPSPLAGDDCMDAGGRATPGAVAEGEGEGCI